MIRYLQDLDTRTFLSFFQSQYQVTLTQLALLVSASANGWCYAILVPLCILLRPEQARELLTLALLAFGAERTLYFVLKNTVRRRRPPAAIAGIQSLIRAADEFSLPSGHTSAAFLFVTLLCLALSPLFAPLYLWAAAVGVSRVVLGVHFFTDVFMGAVLGTTIACFYF
jgi:undecaprenyl-diphosphatase